MFVFCTHRFSSFSFSGHFFARETLLRADFWKKLSL